MASWGTGSIGDGGRVRTASAPLEREQIEGLVSRQILFVRAARLRPQSRNVDISLEYVLTS